MRQFLLCVDSNLLTKEQDDSAIAKIDEMIANSATGGFSMGFGMGHGFNFFGIKGIDTSKFML